MTPAAVPAWQPAAEPTRVPRLAMFEGLDEVFSDRLFRWEGLTAPPADNAEPYTLQWFLSIEHHRHFKQARWIPRLLEFDKHSGETLLGLGSGLGTDWVQYARHDARVIACSPLAAELALVRRNFDLRGLGGRFIHAEPTDLPLGDASVDVVCINGLLHEVADSAAVVNEAFRVLKPGGKVLAVAPARYNVDYWRHFICPWAQARSTIVKHSPWRSAQRSSGRTPDFSARRLIKLFGAFADHRVHKRQLRSREAPWLIRWLPRPWLERLMGRFLVLKAFKPVTCSVILSTKAAA